MADAARSALEQALDLVVYAPLGLALAAQESLPELAAKGRQRAAAQVALARMIGHMAVSQGEKEARRRMGDVAATLSALGVLAGAPLPEPQAEMSQPPQREAPPGASNGKSSAVQPEARPRAALAIPGYDTLSASQVVQRLAGLSAEELDAVHEYEAATRGRRTILSKIAQLQAEPPA